MKKHWYNLPECIKRVLFAEQVAQGNPANEAPFIMDIYANRSEGGFDWDKSSHPNDGSFWSEVLIDGNIDLFYTKYPKYPKDKKTIKLNLKINI
jgi:hypothetical protein